MEENIPVRGKFGRILDVIEKVHSSIVIGLFSVLMVILTVAVIARNSGIPIMWTDELSKILFIWIIFLSAALAMRKGGHLALDLFKNLIKSKIGFSLINILTIIILLLLLNPAIEVIKIGHTSYTSLIGIPWSYLYLPFLLFIVIGVFYNIIELVNHIKAK